MGAGAGTALQHLPWSMLFEGTKDRMHEATAGQTQNCKGLNDAHFVG